MVMGARVAGKRTSAARNAGYGCYNDVTPGVSLGFNSNVRKADLTPN